ncbi:MAG: PIN domain-containing protein [Flavobacteriales bacterium]|nr:PIN domain-containing protein [Flavobacteriales bacterium]
MSGERLVVDTSALIHLLDGTKAIVDLLNGAEVYASFVTEIEMLSSTRGTAEHLLRKKALLNELSIIDINQPIKEVTIELRKRHGLKVPDCLIAATAIHLDLPLVTTDKHFERLKDEVALYLL